MILNMLLKIINDKIYSFAKCLIDFMLAKVCL